jgi:hypothetical protein
MSISKSYKSKYFLTIAIACIAIASIFYLATEIKKFKDIDFLILKLEKLSNLKTYELSNATATDLPIRLGGLQKDKSAYFSANFTFKGGHKNTPENIFQTAPFNSGIRLELNGSTLGVIYSDYQKSNGYTAFILQKNLNINEVHHIKIEALTKEFLRISVDDHVETIRSPYLIFATNEFLIGGGFSLDRTYSGEIGDIKFKYVNYHSWVGSALRHMPRDFASLLTVIAKLGLLLSVFFYLLYRKLNIEAINFPKIDVGENKQIFLLVLLQALFIFFIPPYKYILIQYVYLYLAGILLVRIVIPDQINLKGFIWLFAPLVGLMLNAVSGAYAITFGLPIQLFVILPLLPFCILLAFRALSKDRFFNQRIFPSVDNILPGLKALTFLTPVILLCLWPGFDGINSTTPIRVGPDAALYGFMNQYLLDGGTWSGAVLRLPEFQGMRVGEITKYTNLTMDWPFAYYYRWGLASFQLSGSLINGLDHAYKFGFASLMLPYLLLGGVVFYWLKEVFKLSTSLSVMGFVGFIFNVNLLNLWFEGFYGNTFSLCMYGLLYLLIDSLSFRDGLTIKQKIRNSGFLGLLFAAILVSYGDGLLFVLPVLLAFHGVINLILRRAMDLSLYAQLAAGLLIAVLVLLPCQFLLDWFLISLKQVTEEGGNGYPQPYWAFLSEILGLSNIYQNINASNGGVAMIYSTKQFILTILSTVLLLSVTLFNFFWNRAYCTLGFSAYLLVAIFLYYIYRSNPLNNYAYMKMYAFMLPILFVYFWVAIAYFSKVNVSFIGGRSNIIAFSLAATMVLNGLAYIATYESTSKKVSIKYTLDHLSLSNLNLENAVVFPVGGSLYPYLLPAILRATWLTDGWENQSIKSGEYLFNFINRNIYFFIEKEACSEYKFSAKNLIYDGTSFMILDSGMLVKNLVKFEKVDMSQIKESEVIKVIKSKNCLSR